MKKDLNKAERARVIKILKAIHARDVLQRKEDLAVEACWVTPVEEPETTSAVEPATDSAVDRRD